MTRRIDPPLQPGGLEHVTAGRDGRLGQFACMGCHTTRPIGGARLFKRGLPRAGKICARCVRSRSATGATT